MPLERRRRRSIYVAEG